MEFVESYKSIKMMIMQESDDQKELEKARLQIAKAIIITYEVISLFSNISFLSDKIWIKAVGDSQIKYSQMLFFSVFLLIYIAPSIIPSKYKRISNLTLICISDVIILIYSLIYCQSLYQETAKLNIKKIFDENIETDIIDQFNKQYELQIHTTTLEMVIDNYTFDRTMKMSLLNILLVVVITIVQIYYNYITRPKKKTQ